MSEFNCIAASSSSMTSPSALSPTQYKGREVQANSAPVTRLPQVLANHIFQRVGVQETLELRSVCREWNRYLTHANNLRRLTLPEAKRLGASLYFLIKHPKLFSLAHPDGTSPPFPLSLAQEIVEQRILAHAQKYEADEKEVKAQLDTKTFSYTEQEPEEAPLSFPSYEDSSSCFSPSLIGFYDSSTSKSLPQKSFDLDSFLFQLRRISFTGWIQHQEIAGDFGKHYSPKNILTQHSDNKQLYAFQQGSQTFPNGTKCEGSFGYFWDPNGHLILDGNGKPLYEFQQGLQTSPNGTKCEGSFGYFWDPNGHLILDGNRKPFYAFQQGLQTFPNGTKLEGEFGCFSDPKGHVFTNDSGEPAYELKHGSKTSPNKITLEGEFGIYCDRANQPISTQRWAIIVGLKQGTMTFYDGPIFNGTFDFCLDANDTPIRNKQGDPAIALQEGTITLPDGSRFQGPFPVFFDPLTGKILDLAI